MPTPPPASPPPHPPSSIYPTTLADLAPTSPLTSHPSIYKTLSLLHRHALTITNRLASVHTDSLFVRDLATCHFPSYPVVANERCGSWYVDPELKRGSAYFKSTDGHVGQWAFSLRRLNLGVLEVLASSESLSDGHGDGRKRGGAIIVDSTRRGKRVPDALRRTVPCWVAVWNRVLFEGQEERGRREGWWAVRGLGLERGEVALIEEKVDGWVEGLKGLKLDIEELRRKVRRPIRCVWAVHGEKGFDDGIGDDDDDDEDDDDNDNDSDDNGSGGRDEHGNCYTLVLCSASRRVLGAEMSEDGYIQGAGDDNESWSCGLTAESFWKHKDQLMHTGEDDLPELIERLVQDDRKDTQPNQVILIKPTTNLYVASQGDIQCEGPPAGYDAMIICNGAKSGRGKDLLQLGCRSGKLGSRDLRGSLALVEPFAAEIFKQNPESKVLVTCQTGRDLAVGVILVLLCMYYNEQGGLSVTGELNRTVDKQLVKQRLAWVTSCKPDANPSGATLQAANALLMGRPP